MVAERRTNRPPGEESDMQAAPGHGSIRQAKSQTSRESPALSSQDFSPGNHRTFTLSTAGGN